MRVLFFLTRFPELSETFVLNQITGLIDLGVDVVIVSQNRPKSGPVHTDFDSYRLAERVIYLQDSDGGYYDSVIGTNYSNLLWGLAGLRVLRFGRKATNGYLRAVIKAWRRYCQGLEFDIVISHFVPAGDLALCLRSLGLFQAPIATVVHGFDISKKLFRNQPVNPRLRAKGDLMIPISQRWYDALIKDGFDPNKTVLHHVGIALPQSSVERVLSHPGEPLRIMTVARFVEKKGLEYAIEALALLKSQSGLDFHFTVVGTGPLLPNLEKLCRRLGVDMNITFTGPLSKRDVHFNYTQNDIFLLPSVTAADGDQEGIPTVLMEAISEGLIPISTFHSGIPELIEHNVSGLLTPERQSQALCEALLRLDQDRGLWDSYRKAGRKKVELEFNITKLNEKLKCLLESTAGLS